MGTGRGRDIAIGAYLVGNWHYQEEVTAGRGAEKTFRRRVEARESGREGIKAELLSRDDLQLDAHGCRGWQRTEGAEFDARYESESLRSVRCWRKLQRAYRRDPQAIALWQQLTYRALAREAKRDGAQILLWDESGFRADTVHGETWRLRGQTPMYIDLGSANRSRPPRCSVRAGSFGSAPRQVD